MLALANTPTIPASQSWSPPPHQQGGWTLSARRHCLVYKLLEPRGRSYCSSCGHAPLHHVSVHPHSSSTLCLLASASSPPLAGTSVNSVPSFPSSSGTSRRSHATRVQDPWLSLVGPYVEGLRRAQPTLAASPTACISPYPWPLFHGKIKVHFWLRHAQTCRTTRGRPTRHRLEPPWADADVTASFR